MEATFTYEPALIGQPGKDKMRFELGDFMVDEPNERYLSDEEITAVIEAHPKSWKRAKLALVESLLHRFAYEVDTKSGPVSWSLSQRYKAWKALRDELKAEVEGEENMPPLPFPPSKMRPPYFYEGMHDNRRGLRGHVSTTR